MTEVLPPASRQLVKDGEWQVPPRERPRGWETMSVRETVEHTETHTLTTREAILEPAEMSGDPIFAESTEATDLDAPLSPLPQKKISFIPDNDPVLERRIVDCIVDLYGPIDVPDGEMDRLSEEYGNAGESLFRYREAKKVVDGRLNEWKDRHREKLRHVGLGSPPIKDLWMVVHGVLFEFMEQAEAKRKKDVRHAAHGDKCICWECEQDKGKRDVTS